MSQNDETDWQCILRARTHGETVAHTMADGNPIVSTVEHTVRSEAKAEVESRCVLTRRRVYREGGS